MADTPRDLALDANGDLFLVGGDLAFVSGVESIRQDAECRLRLIRGEWFLAPDEGVPYFTDAFVKNPSLPRLRAVLTDTLLATPGIAAVQELELRFDPATRRLTGTFNATTDTGELLTGRLGATP